VYDDIFLIYSTYCLCIVSCTYSNDMCSLPVVFVVTSR